MSQRLTPLRDASTLTRGLLIFAGSLIVGLTSPAMGWILAPVLLIGGALTLRRVTERGTRIVAAFALAAGVIVLAARVVVWLLVQPVP